MYHQYKVVDNENEMGKVVIAQFSYLTHAAFFVSELRKTQGEDSARYQILDRD
jgi:hypothetical protein